MSCDVISLCLQWWPGSIWLTSMTPRSIPHFWGCLWRHFQRPVEWMKVSQLRAYSGPPCVETSPWKPRQNTKWTKERIQANTVQFFLNCVVGHGHQTPESSAFKHSVMPPALQETSRIWTSDWSCLPDPLSWDFWLFYWTDQLLVPSFAELQMAIMEPPSIWLWMPTWQSPFIITWTLSYFPFSRERSVFAMAGACHSPTGPHFKRLLASWCRDKGRLWRLCSGAYMTEVGH